MTGTGAATRTTAGATTGTGSRGHPGGPDPQLRRGPRLALWAESVCDGRDTYHRVAVRPELDLDEGQTAILGAEDRAKLARTARRLMDRYLNASDGWPKAAGCHDTKVLGEAEEWH
ncbi:hypothetical protein NKH77_36270 [Streptomyces sp. M19]